MASTPYISHSVNGYSRYDVPQNIAFTATPGIIYPVRCDFLNARDITYIQAGAIVRANPMTVPSFTPYQVRLHRFFIPMQLYHPEMRVNSSGFDMRNLSTNAIPTSFRNFGELNTDEELTALGMRYINPRSATAMLNLSHGTSIINGPTANDAGDHVITDSITLGYGWVNGDPLLGYWDVVRNYFAFSQAKDFSLVFPTPVPLTQFGLHLPSNGAASTNKLKTTKNVKARANDRASIWHQYFGSLAELDRFFETCFYPRGTDPAAPIYDRTSLYGAIYASLAPELGNNAEAIAYRAKNTYFTYQDGNSKLNILGQMICGSPLGVAPSMPDRLSRLLPTSVNTDVQITNIKTVRELAVASRLQEYTDLLTSGGNRFTDWLQTFFAAKVKHVDRPILLYSSSFYLNSSPIFNQASAPGAGLGEFGGTLSGQNSFGKNAQRYCFDEPGYLMDIAVIRPLYYWSGIVADYALYRGMDYFNPLFNEVGYQTVPAYKYSVFQPNAIAVAVGKEPCFNEVRGSYDELHGAFAAIPGLPDGEQPDVIYHTWGLQRGALSNAYFPSGQLVYDFSAHRYCDIPHVNDPFASSAEDNFFVNIYYRVSKKSLVSKNFATNLSNR